MARASNTARPPSRKLRTCAEDALAEPTPFRSFPLDPIDIDKSWNAASLQCRKVLAIGDVENQRDVGAASRDDVKP